MKITFILKKVKGSYHFIPQKGWGFKVITKSKTSWIVELVKKVKEKHGKVHK